MSSDGLVRLLLAVVAGAPMLASAAESTSLTFDNEEALKVLTVSGDVSVDMEKDRGGVKGLAAEGVEKEALKQGGALRLGPGSRATWPLHQQDGTGRVEIWIYEDAAIASDPRTHGAGPMWGLMQSDGRMAAVGPLYAPYLDGAHTYAISTLDPAKERPWQEVQYLGVRRAPGWHKWTFDFDPDKGMRILYDDRQVDDRHFNWNQSKLEGFKSVVLFGDTTDSKQVLWVDDVTVTLGPRANVKPVWPPPPPTPPADLTVLPPQAPWNPTPYAQWQNGPGKTEDYFPIAVWLQDPRNAPRYKAAGINLYLGLWRGPTEEQIKTLGEAGVPVICDLNEYARAHLHDTTFVAWMHGDEPDNAHPFKEYWKQDIAKMKEAWPGLFDNLRPNNPYRGYGPPIPPRWIVRDYEAMKATDPTRPVFLGCGQGVAWEKWHGRGERTGHLEDYAEYIQGCDIVGFDIYPAAHDSLDVKDALWYVPRGVHRLRKWCKDAKPVWVHIETGIIGVPSSQPTPPQVKAEVWMAIIHGARGIDYFVHQFKPKFNEHALLDNPEMLATVTTVNKQIASLARVLNSPTIPDAILVESTNPRTPVHTLLKRKDGATYVFAAAMYAEATQATFKIAGQDGERTAEVLDENRSIPVKDGRFSDAFKGYAVHIYRIAQAEQ